MFIKSSYCRKLFFHKSYNFVVHTFTFLNIRSEACPGFILGGAETIFGRENTQEPPAERERGRNI